MTFSFSQIAAAARTSVIQSTLTDHGWEGRQAIAVKSASDALSREGMGRQVAGIAAAALKAAGAHAHPDTILFGRMARGDTPVVESLLRPVYKALITKRANAGPVALSSALKGNLLSQALMGSSSAYATLLGLSAVAGSGIGALNWHLKRQVNDDEAEESVLAAQTKVLQDQLNQMKGSTPHAV